jgi:hypothetical protein
MQPFDLDSAVSQRSWEWLVEVSHRLDVVIELIDDDDVPLLPAGPAPEAAAVRRLVTTPHPSLAAAIAEARRASGPALVALERFQAVCVGLSPAGVLVLAQEPTGEPAADCRQQLECAGTWLAEAIGASLANPPDAISVESYRMASLRRILNDAAAAASPRKVIGAFVEALGVWDNVRVRCYAAGAAGGFFHYVSPVGTPPLSAPADLGAVPRSERVVRLARAEADQLGFAADAGDVLLLQLGTGDEPGWLLLFSGSIDDAEQARLAVYADMLRESLDDVRETRTRMVVDAVPAHQLGRNEPLDTATDAVLEQLSMAVAGHQAALTVTTVTGIRALALGNTSLIPAPGQPPSTDRLIVTSSDIASVMTMVVAREGSPFMAFEREIMKAAVAMLHPWIQAALQRSTESERRRRFRPLESLFDQLADKAIDAGQEASVIVVSVDASVSSLSLLQSWLGSIRIQLRAGDFAGILSDTEIGVLLCDTSADQAAVVSARLKQLVEADRRDAVFPPPVLGATTRSPQLPFDGSLVSAARADAAAIR